MAKTQFPRDLGDETFIIHISYPHSYQSDFTTKLDSLEDALDYVSTWAERDPGPDNENSCEVKIYAATLVSTNR